MTKITAGSITQGITNEYKNEWEWVCQDIYGSLKLQKAEVWAFRIGKWRSKLQLAKSKRQEKDRRTYAIGSQGKYYMKDLWSQGCVRTWLYEPPPSSHTHLPCLHILLQISELKRQSNEAVVYFGHKIGSLVPGQNSSSLDPPTHSPFTQALGLLAPEDAENHHPTQRKGVRVRPTRDPKGAWGSAGCDDIRERDMSDTPCLLGLLEMASGVYPSTSSWKWCYIWGILYFSGPNYRFPGFPPMLTW